MAPGREVGLGPDHIVSDGNLVSPSAKEDHVYCRQTGGWIKMPLGTKLGLDPGHIVLHWDPVTPAQKEDRAHQFSAHVYCGQTAGWTKVVLGMAVGLVPGHIVLDGDQVPPPKRGRHRPPIFVPCLFWPNGWMDQGITRPRPHCVRWKPSFPLSKRGAEPPIFGPCLLWPNGWMDQDVT